MKNFLSFFVILIAMACSSPKKLPDQPSAVENREIIPGFDVQGHRGARGLMPENTFPAMKLALDMGVTTLEMDIVLTKDKQALLSHEPFFNYEISTRPDGSPVTEGEETMLNIYQMNYEEVKKYDVGVKPHPRFPRQQKIQVYKPLLADLIDSVQQYMLTVKRPLPYYNIETKTQPSTDNIFHPEPAEFVEELMKVILEKKIEDHVIIQSFDFRTLQYLHKKYPGIKTAMLIEDFDERGLKDQLKSLGFIPTIYSPEYKLVTEDLVNKCHEQNIK
ncbi:MAG: glycerophosphodiester phosphodiesterase family protein, partial [Chitinophagaceae bacterium]